MKKGEIYEGIIEKVDFPNKGRDVAEGKTVTVKNGIPGQKVRFLINKKRGDRLEEGLRCGKNLLWKSGNQCAVFFRTAEAVCIRQWSMKIS